VSRVVPPLALYVHMPWCVRKCPYCDFNSHAVPAAGLPERAYLNALLDDLGFAASGLEERELISVFFGGGTPSLFGAASIGAVLERAARLFRVGDGVEVTIEANPGTIERGRFADYRSIGVNRVSLGAQSFDDTKLATLGRIHAAKDTVAAVEELTAAGLENFNLDLMYALPRQTAVEALADLERALALRPAHLSLYQLTLEPGTAFERRPPPLPDDESAFEMQIACQAMLAAAGYRQYEVSAYALAGRACRHNLNYWEFGDYVGIGAGAHGKLTDQRSGKVLRTARVRQPGRYSGAPSAPARIEDTRVLSQDDIAFEFMLNALRLVDGFDERLFFARTGLPWSSVERRVCDAVARGLLASAGGGRWCPTPLGQRFLNDLQAIFLPAESDSGTPGRAPGLVLGGGFG